MLYAPPLSNRLTADASAITYNSNTSSHYNNSSQSNWNILFYNVRTRALRQLAGGRKLIVWSVEPVGDEVGTLAAHRFAPSPYTDQNLLLYPITTTDSNHDG